MGPQPAWLFPWVTTMSFLSAPRRGYPGDLETSGLSGRRGNSSLRADPGLPVEVRCPHCTPTSASSLPALAIRTTPAEESDI